MTRTAMGILALLFVIIGVMLACCFWPKKSEEQKKETKPSAALNSKGEVIEIETEIPTEPIEPSTPEQPVEVVEPEQPVEPAPAPAPPAKVEWIPGQHRDPNQIVVVIDPGHQLRGNSTKEPNGPNSTVMKARVTSGTTGKFTGVPEYILNLDIGLKLKTELENRGYTVHMTRSVHEVDISNMERAQYASSVGADIAVRIHANGSTNPSVKGALTMTPSASNPYVSHLANASYSLSKKVIDAYCAATGFENDGVLASDTMTGMNWSEVPVTIVEMGYMSNESDDRAMQDATMQNNMVQGIANGIDAYFGL
ncbi:MAG: N-acetylmuramoyl-L-alanine amidase [Faecalimonas sp.]|nr:N-acetylmuramoyl-L-alanine amidase [Faecalimonas sp.]